MQNKEKIGVFLEHNGASKTSEIAKMLGLSEARTRALLKEMASEVLPQAVERKRKFTINRKSHTLILIL